MSTLFTIKTHARGRARIRPGEEMTRVWRKKVEDCAVCPGRRAGEKSGVSGYGRVGDFLGSMYMRAYTCTCVLCIVGGWRGELGESTVATLAAHVR